MHRTPNALLYEGIEEGGGVDTLYWVMGITTNHFLDKCDLHRANALHQNWTQCLPPFTIGRNCFMERATSEDPHDCRGNLKSYEHAASVQRLASRYWGNVSQQLNKQFETKIDMRARKNGWKLNFRFNKIRLKD